MGSNLPLLNIEGLTISSKQSEIISDLNLSISQNEIVAIVGESGSGKTLTALSILGLLSDSKLSLKSKRMRLNEIDLTNLSAKDWQNIRGKNLGVIFQEPQSSLNPTMRCGQQVMERLNKYGVNNKTSHKRKVLEAFENFKLPNPERIFMAYPHQLSGGQKQRVMITLALICDPQLLIADEPTTALDVSVQNEILDLLKNQQKTHKMSILFISHDLSLVAQFADRVMVMYKGKIIESNKTSQIFKNPKTPYTNGLISARPKVERRLAYLPTVQDFLLKKNKFEVISSSERKKRHKVIYAKSPILEVKNLCKEYPLSRYWFNKNEVLKAIKNFSFELYPGETLGLVGESGCGKSTISRILVKLDTPSSGNIFYEGEEFSKLDRSTLKEIQLVFQDPFAALHPLINVGKAIEEPLKLNSFPEEKKIVKERVYQLMEQVGINSKLYYRYPHELSGGQRQRIVIARALAVKPKLLILDEGVAALDLSVQATVLNLLNDLKKKLKLSYLFISHDLNLVKYFSDRIMVMKNGIMIEQGEADYLYKNPKNDYTKKLISLFPKT